MPEQNPLVEATAGALGSLFTCVLLMPVDTAKVQMQAGRSKRDVAGTMNAIVSAQGLSGLFKGLPTKAAHTVLQNFLYFFAYEWFKARRKGLRIKASTLVNTVCGVLAGVSNLTVTLPLETILVRIQASDSQHVSVAQHASDLVASGAAGIWRGFGISSVLTLNPALTVAVFDVLKLRLTKLTKRSSLTTLEGFLIGSVSKALATLITYPLIRTKVVMQAQSRTSDEGSTAPATTPGAPSPNVCAERRAKRMSEIFLEIWQSEGLSGLYRGCYAQIFTAVSKSGILLTVKERLAALALLLLLRGRSQHALK